MTTKHIEKDTVILRNTVKSDYVYVIKSGIWILFTLTETGEAIVFGLLGKGQTVGESEAFLSDRKAIYLKALTDVEVCQVPLESYRNSSLHSADLLVDVLCASMANMNSFCRFTWVMGERNVYRRVKKLMRVLIDAGMPIDANGAMTFDLSHDSIAQVLKTDRPSVSRALGRLEEEGFLVLKYRKIIVSVDKFIEKFGDGTPYPTFTFDGSQVGKALHEV